METKPKNPNYKYWSKLYKGILKQHTRQLLKPDVSKVTVYPEILSYSRKHGKYRPLKRKYLNRKFKNGIHDLVNDSYFKVVRETDGMYTRCLKDRVTGRYTLSKHGKEYLNRLRAKKSAKK